MKIIKNLQKIILKHIKIYETFKSHRELEKLTSVVSQVNELRSICFTNDGNGKFDANPLPAQMQFSSINALITDDLNNDGILDIITVGNLYYMHVNLGRQDGDFGSVAVGKGNGEFNYIENSGLSIKGQVNAAVEISINGKKYYVFTLNNNPLKFYTKKTYEK